MIPIRDDNPQIHRPYATYGIIALNIIVWLILQGAGNEPTLSNSLCEWGLITGALLDSATGFHPCLAANSDSWLTLLSSMFMHGDWLHIAGNLWFLWIFGNNIEDVMGPVKFIIFYLLTGIAAAGAQMLSDTTAIGPMIGASGAISGVMGAYLMLYPRVHVHLFIFITTLAVPAILVIGYWFALDIIGGLGVLGDDGGVAFWAHIGGFIAGCILVWLLVDRKKLNQHPYHGWQPQAHNTQKWKPVNTTDKRWQ